MLGTCEYMSGRGLLVTEKKKARLIVVIDLAYKLSAGLVLWRDAVISNL